MLSFSVACSMNNTAEVTTDKLLLSFVTAFLQYTYNSCVSAKWRSLLLDVTVRYIVRWLNNDDVAHLAFQMMSLGL